MAQLNVCAGCLKTITSRRYLTCSLCKEKYDIKCGSVGEKRFYLMTIEDKKRWKCQTCICKIPKSGNINTRIINKKLIASTPNLDSALPTIEDEDQTLLNIAKKEKKTKKQFVKNMIDSPQKSSLLSPLSPRSPSFISIDSISNVQNQHCDECEELQSKINSLKVELANAHQKIEVLILENHSFKNRKNTQDLSTPVTPENKKIEQSNNKKNSESRCEYFCNDQKLIKDILLNPEQSGSNKETPLKQKDLENRHKAANEQGKNCFTDRRKKIWIFGSQRCVGFAANLVDLRKNTNYEVYDITSTTRPNASTEQVLNDCIHSNISKLDKIVIGIGENDSNPVMVTSELYNFLKCYRNNDIFVLNVVSNNCLNENMLNDQLKLLCNTFDNCQFVETNCCRQSINLQKYTCKKLNSAIDYIDYKTNFLTFKNLKCRKTDTYQTEGEKTTPISYVHVPNSQTKHILSEKIPVDISSTAIRCQQPSKLYKKTLIDYFPIIDKTLKTNTQNKDTFFRH